MRACARLAEPVCLMHPLADDLSRPCKLHNHPRVHLPYPVVADDSHTPVNPRADNAEKSIKTNELIGRPD